MVNRLIRNAGVIFTCGTLLAGCDLVSEVGHKVAALAGHNEPITLVIPPGYRVNIAGVSTPMFGFDKCPPPDETQRKLFNSGPVASEPICTVIKPDAATVEVLVGLPGGPERETWSVERAGDKTRLKRPDGTLVVSGE